MKIHEYQARDVFSQYGIPTIPGLVAATPAAARKAAEDLGGRVVVKVQVHVGGRGKAGGVKLARTPEEAEAIAASLLGTEIKGAPVTKVMLAKAIDIKREVYLGVTLDRANKRVAMITCAAGGVEIEQLAIERPEEIHTLLIDPGEPLSEGEVNRLAEAVFPEPGLEKQGAEVLRKLYQVFIDKDCSLAEINPMVVDGEGNLLAVDAKMVLDDNALFRHPDMLELRDPEQEDADEVAAKEVGLSFVKMDGCIGCIVNGAGLAMATMDLIKHAGGDPANFLDVGGSSNPDKVLHALKIILSNPKVKAIVINIFGGITRCDDIATGIIRATNQIEIPVPVSIRLTGTNEEKAAEMLKDTKLETSSTMAEAIQKAVSSAVAGGVA